MFLILNLGFPRSDGKEYCMALAYHHLLPQRPQLTILIVFFITLLVPFDSMVDALLSLGTDLLPPPPS
jgi:hypothetical protein